MLKMQVGPEQWTTIQAITGSASDSSLSRMGCFTVHLLRSPCITERKWLYLGVIELCLRKISRKDLADRFKAIVFDAPIIQKLLTGFAGDDHRDRKSNRVPAMINVLTTKQELESIAGHLHADDAGDRALAEVYIRQIIEVETGHLNKNVKEAGLERVGLPDPSTGVHELTEISLPLSFDLGSFSSIGLERVKYSRLSLKLFLTRRNNTQTMS